MRISLKRICLAVTVPVVLVIIVGLYLNSITQEPTGENANEYKTRYNPELPANSITTNNIHDEDKFPPLSLPAEYFDDSPTLYIGVGAYYTLHNDNNSYRSYPSTIISLSNDSYTSIPTPLPKVQSNTEIFSIDPKSDFFGTTKQQNIKEYGDLARRYVGPLDEALLLDDVVYADVDADGNNEQILFLTELGANVIGGRNVVIKDGMEIFSTTNTTFSTIIPVESGNGFYLQWSDNFKMRDGHMKTRFIYEDGIFKPIYEQQIRYVRFLSNSDD